MALEHESTSALLIMKEKGSHKIWGEIKHDKDQGPSALEALGISLDHPETQKAWPHHGWLLKEERGALLKALVLLFCSMRLEFCSPLL